MAKSKRVVVSTPAPLPLAVPGAVELPDAFAAKPWFRLRLVAERGVRGWVLERLDVKDGQPRIVRVHDLDVRDATLGHLLREVELSV